jgi:hypothetical protein
MFARGMRIISMTRGVGRKHIGVRTDNHLGSTALFQESVLKLGAGVTLSSVGVGVDRS